jgi:hypothetical protein
MAYGGSYLVAAEGNTYTLGVQYSTGEMGSSIELSFIMIMDT